MSEYNRGDCCGRDVERIENAWLISGKVQVKLYGNSRAGGIDDEATLRKALGGADGMKKKKTMMMMTTTTTMMMRAWMKTSTS